MTQNEQAFLAMIAWSEGTSTNPATINNGYDVIVTGIDGQPEVFSDYSTHPFEHRPAKLLNDQGLCSTASGRYQHLKRYFDSYRDSLKLPDFGPDSQDRIALQQIGECNAIIDLMNGKVLSAINKCASRWASLPGNSYAQPQHQLTDLVRVYCDAGGWCSDFAYHSITA